MALFKILKGLKTNLPSDKKDGYCYFTTDDQMFYIDYLDANNQMQRKPLNANDAKTLLGKGVVESLIGEASGGKNVIPTSAAVYVKVSELQTAIDSNDQDITNLQNNKMDKANPVGTGTLSINRLDSSTIGVNSVAVGTNNTASGNSAFAEGYGTIAEGAYSHAEGQESRTDKVAFASHAEGYDTIASGRYSHSEGNGGLAGGEGAHVEGYESLASGDYSHAEGNGTIASGQFSHAEGNGTIANHKSQHVQGEWNIADSNDNPPNSRGTYAHIIGNGTSGEARSNALTVKWNGDFWTAGSFANGNATAEQAYSFASGYDATASGAYSHAEGLSVLAEGEASHVEGYRSEATGDYSHAEGSWTEATGEASHAEGDWAKATGDYSHAEGGWTKAIGDYSHAEGDYTEASGEASHAEGTSTIASGDYSHAEGEGTTASGYASHTEGGEATASGDYSHSGGYTTEANGKYAFVHGSYLTANGENQAVFGKYNTPNTTDIFQIGGGTSDITRFNAFSITAGGAAKIKSSLNIGGAVDNSGITNLLFVSGRGYFEGGIRTGSNYYPSNNKDLVTKDYVSNNLPQLSHVYRTASTDGTTSFNFSGDIADLTQNFYLVYFNGLLLVEGVHYTVNGTTVNLLDWSCRANDMCHVVGFKPLSGDASATNVIATSY